MELDFRPVSLQELQDEQAKGFPPQQQFEGYEPPEDYPPAVPYLPETMQTAQSAMDLALYGTDLATRTGNLIDRTWNPPPDFDFRPVGLEEGLRLTGTAIDLANIGLQAWNKPVAGIPFEYQAPPEDPLRRAAQHQLDYGRFSGGGYEGPTTLPGGLTIEDTGQALPRLIAPPEAGAVEKIATGTANVAASIPNFIATPEGFATLLVPEVAGPVTYAKYLSPIVRGFFAGTMAKTAGEQLGQASVTGNVQDWTEGILSSGMAGFLPFMKEGRLLTRSQEEFAALMERRMQENAAKERLKQEGGVPEYQGTESTRVSTETGGGNRPVPATGLEEKTQILLDQIAGELRKEGLGSELEQKSIGRNFQAQPAIVDENGNYVRPGKIYYDPQKINEMLREGWRPDQIEQYFRTVMLEEGIHTIVTDAEALKYHNTLTWAERKLRERIYRGLFKRDVEDYTPTNLGHEFIRQRLQRAWGSSLSEFQLIARAERWSMQAMEALANLIQTLRERIGTTAAIEGRKITLAMLDRAAANVDSVIKDMKSGVIPPPPEVDEETGREFGGEQPFGPKAPKRPDERESYLEWERNYKTSTRTKLDAFDKLKENLPQDQWDQLNKELLYLQSLSMGKLEKTIQDALVGKWPDEKIEALRKYWLANNRILQLEKSQFFDDYWKIYNQGISEPPWAIGPDFGPNAPARRYSTFKDWYSSWNAIEDYRRQMLTIIKSGKTMEEINRAQSVALRGAFMNAGERKSLIDSLDWPDREKRALSFYFQTIDRTRELQADPHYRTLSTVQRQGASGQPSIGADFGPNAPKHEKPSKPYGFWIDPLGLPSLVGGEGHRAAAEAIFPDIGTDWGMIYQNMEKRGYRRANTDFTRRILFIDIPEAGLSTAVEKAARELGRVYGYERVEGIFAASGRRMLLWENPEFAEGPFAPQRKTIEERKADYNRYWELRKKITGGIRSAGKSLTPEELSQVFGEIEQIKNKYGGMPPRWPELPGGLVLSPERRKTRIWREPPKMDVELYESLAQRLRNRRYAESEADLFEVVAYYASMPETKWNLPGKHKAALKEWFKNAEGTGFGYIELLDFNATTSEEMAHNLLSENTEIIKAIANYSKNIRDQLNQDLPEYLTSRDAFLDGIRQQFSEQLTEWKNIIHKNNVNAQTFIDQSREMRSLLKDLTGRHHPEYENWPDYQFQPFTQNPEMSAKWQRLSEYVGMVRHFDRIVEPLWEKKKQGIILTPEESRDFYDGRTQRGIYRKKMIELAKEMGLTTPEPKEPGRPPRQGQLPLAPLRRSVKTFEDLIEEEMQKFLRYSRDMTNLQQSPLKRIFWGYEGRSAHKVLNDLIEEDLFPPNLKELAKSASGLGEKGIEFWKKGVEGAEELRGKGDPATMPGPYFEHEEGGRTYGRIIFPPPDTVLMGIDLEYLPQAFLHEYVHGLTSRELVKNWDFREEVGRLAAASHNWFRQNGDTVNLSPRGMVDWEYAFENPHEFLAVAFSNPEVQSVLKQIPYRRSSTWITTIWDSLVRSIGKLLGFQENSVLHQSISLVMEMGEAQPKRPLEQPGLFGEDFPFSPKRRGKPDTGTPEMFMPEVRTGEQVERGRPVAPVTATAVQQRADEHFKAAAETNELPDFEKFRGSLEQSFGPMNKDAVFYAWNDAVVRTLMSATGKELDQLVDRYKLRKDIARALKPQEADPTFPHNRIPDRLEMPAVQMQLGEIARHFQQRKWRTAAAWRKQFGPAQQARYAAIGALMDKMMEQAGSPPKKPWDRPSIGPEDVAQISTVVQPGTEVEVEGGTRQLTAADIASVPTFRAIPLDIRGNPVKLGEFVTTGAAVDASGPNPPPRTVTKNVIAMRDQWGKIVMVSTWRDPRGGPKIANPEVADLPGKKIDANLLKQWTPFYIAHLREPVRNFRQVFRNQAEFDAWWGGLIEGTEGLRTSSFVGPDADIANAQAGIGALGRARALEEMPPMIPETPFVSETARELTMPQRPAPIETGQVPPERPVPAPTPTLSELPAEPGAFDFRPIPEGAAEKVEEFSYGKPTGRIIEVGKPEKMGPGWPLREGALKGQYSAGKGARYQPSTTRYPTAPMRAQKLRADELWQRFVGGVRASWTRKDVMKDIPRLLGGAENSASLEAQLAANSIRLASGEPIMTPRSTAKDLLADPITGLERMRARKAEKKEKRSTSFNHRAGSLAFIATGSTDPRTGRWRGNYHFLKDLDDLLSAGRTQAFSYEHSLDPRKKIIGRRWRVAVEEMQDAVDWARRHWRDPVFRQTVDAVRRELADEIAFENAHDFKVKERDNYTPNRYEAPFFADNTISFGPNPLRGAAFKKQRTFSNMFEAIANGPYLPASLDAADLVQHRIATGRRAVMRHEWLADLKGMIDPDSGEKVAMEPKPVIEMVPAVDPVTGIHYEQQRQTGWMTPKENYRLVQLNRGRPIAVRKAYYHLVDVLMSDSKFDHAPLGREALLAAGLIKHGILLLIDTFHLGRLTDYQMALLGKKAGFRGGVSSLMVRESEMDAAVQQGWITQKAADWARQRIPIQHVGPRGITSTSWMTRQQMAHELVKQGLNATKITDALYRDVVERVPFIGKTWQKAFGWYNKWLFDQYVPGMIVESAVAYMEKYNKKFPRIPLNRIMRDVVTDTNVYYGNLGRQSALKSATWRDLAQVTLLAPMWLEGLIQKDIRFYSRLTGLSYLMGRRKVPYWGVVGTGVGRGLLAFTVLTQILNLITRHQPTWQNPEEGHKMDAWIPIRGGEEGEGFWLSPMSIFSEIVHDIARLTESKASVHKALLQIGANKLGPVGKMMGVFLTGQAPTGEVYSSSAGVAKGMAKQLFPAPIAFGTPTRALAHAIAPEYISPPRRGALTQQILASLASLKVQAGQTPLQEIKKLGRKFLEDEGLDPNTMVFLPTDLPSYTKFRAAVRNDDRPGARKLLEQLRERHSDAEIIKAMNEWAQAPITNSRKNDRLFKATLDDRQLDLYERAMWEKKEELELIKEFIREN